MKKVETVILTVLLGPITCSMLSCERSSSPATIQPAIPKYVAAQGKVETLPGYDVNVGTGELNGKIATILVNEGDSVTKGQLLAALQNDDLKARTEAAERQLAVTQSRLKEIESGARREEILEAMAALDGAKARLKETQRQVQRYRDLHRQHTVSQADLDQVETAFKAAQADVAQADQRKKLLQAGPKPETVQLYRDQVALAQAELDLARKLLDNTYVHAPIAGTVIQRYLQEGEGVTPEIPILDIADLDKIWINAEVDETDIGKIHVGDTVEVTSEAYANTVFHGHIHQIADYVGVRKITPGNPAVNLGLKVVQVKIALDEKTPLKLGLTVDVKILPSGT